MILKKKTVCNHNNSINKSQVLDAREPLPVGADRAGFRVHTDQLTVPDERHASVAH